MGWLARLEGLFCAALDSEGEGDSPSWSSTDTGPGLHCQYHWLSLMQLVPGAHATCRTEDTHKQESTEPQTLHTMGAALDLGLEFAKKVAGRRCRLKRVK